MNRLRRALLVRPPRPAPIEALAGSSDESRHLAGRRN